MIKIAIADDHPLVISGLKHILGNCPDMQVCGTYANGKELLEGLAAEQPDVLLLDIQMPGQTGDELAVIIYERYPAIRIIVLTNLDNVYYIKNMQRRGVHGYILKTAREDVLLDAIRTVDRGGHYLAASLQDKVQKDNLQAKRELSANPILTMREKEVLQCIAANLTSQQIADKLKVSKRTVDNHRQSLHMKLGVKNAAALAKKALQMGLIE